MLYCAIEKIDITFRLGALMPGYYHERPAKDVRDRMEAVICAFRNEEKTVALISADIQNIPPKVEDETRLRIAELLGCGAEDIIICAIHTHTGAPRESVLGVDRERAGVDKPDTSPLGNKASTDFLAEKLIELTKKAKDGFVPVKIGFGKSHEKNVGFVRDYYVVDKGIMSNPAFMPKENIIAPVSEFNDDVNVMRIDRVSGEPFGMIVNFGCHCDCVAEEADEYAYSSDYAGQLRNVLNEHFGGDFKTLFINGFSGDVNHIDFISGVYENGYALPKDHYKTMGRILAKDALEAYDSISDMTDEVPIFAKEEKIRIKTRVPSKEEYEKAKQTVDVISKIPNGQRKHEDRMALSFAVSHLYFYERKDKFVDLPVKLLRMGKAVFFALPVEMYTEFGNEFKRKSGYEYNFTVNLAGGTYGYIPTKLTFEKMTTGFAELSGSAYLVPEAGYMMLDKALEMIKDMK